jgi:hypothetical protein
MNILSMMNMSTAINDEEEIDNNWVEAYKKEEELYNTFYNEKVNTITIFFMYINRDTTNTKQKVINIHDNKINSEEVIDLINKNNIYKNNRYKLFSLMQYNINLQPEELNEFIENSKHEDYAHFLKTEQYATDIHFIDTIGELKELNSLYIIFKTIKANTIKANTTKKNIISSINIKRHKTRHKH